MRILIISTVLLLFTAFSSFAQVAINETGAEADTSAILDLSSTNKGFLVPRVTTAQRNAISTTQSSLMVYDTDTESFWFWNNNQSAWIEIKAGSALDINSLADGSSDGSSIFLGDSAGISDDGNNNNIAIGINALKENTTGVSNVAIGNAVLEFSTGNSNLVAIGDSALHYNSNNFTICNTAVGAKSMLNNTRGSYNTANGVWSLYSNTSGDNNTANGGKALYSNKWGDNNTAAGFKSLYSNTTGDDNTAVGSYSLYNDTTGFCNVAIGSGSLYSNFDGGLNTAIGYKAMYFPTAAHYNVAMGAYSLNYTQQSYLVAVGYGALHNNSMGTANTAVGSRSLYYNGTGYHNTALGFESLTENTTAENNTAIGYYSLRDNITGGKNTAIGSQSMYQNTTGICNTSVGALSGDNNETGNYNTNIGYLANAYNESGSNNTAIGTQAGQGTIGNSVSGCVFIGYQAGKDNADSNKLFIDNSSTSTPLIGGDFSTNQVDINGTVKITGGTPGDGKVLTSDANGLATWETPAVYASEINDLNDAYNVGSKMFMGTNAGLNNTGGYNIGVGYESLKLNTTGTHNTAFGFKSLDANTEGIGNTGLGLGALGANTTGDYNTAVGRESLDGNATGNYNTAVGYNAFPSGNYSNSVAIGYNTTVSGNNQVHIGNTSITEIKGQVPFTTYSDGRIKENIQEDVKGLDFILKLRPVTYTINLDKENRLLGMKDNTDFPRKYDIEKIKRTGFIAQEVETAAKSSNYDFSGVQKPKNDKDLYGLSYAEFVVPLVKSVQELNQKLEKENRMLKNRLEQLEKAILELQQNK